MAAGPCCAQGTVEQKGRLPWFAIAISIIPGYAAIWVRGTIRAMIGGFVSCGRRCRPQAARKKVDRGEIERRRVA